jgi:hypothetical protein
MSYRSTPTMVARYGLPTTSVEDSWMPHTTQSGHTESSSTLKNLVKNSLKNTNVNGRLDQTTPLKRCETKRLERYLTNKKKRLNLSLFFNIYYATAGLAGGVPGLAGGVPGLAGVSASVCAGFSVPGLAGAPGLAGVSACPSLPCSSPCSPCP